MVTIPTRLRVDLTSPQSLAAVELNTARRGFDRDEVRALLDLVATELQRLRDENDRLTDELAAARLAPVPELDEATVAALLGAETARVLATAKEAAAQIRANAEDGAERMRLDAQADADRQREDAAHDAARFRQDAEAAAGGEVEAAKNEGRQMVNEARAVRERMLTDLARRRDAARAQLVRLRADRDRLVAAFEAAGQAVDEVLGELRDVSPGLTDVETVDEAVVALLVVEADAEPDDDVAVGAADDVVEIEHPQGTTGVVLEMVELEVADGDDAEIVELPVVFHLGEQPEPGLSYAGELDDGPERRTAVDDLFARIRAAGPADVAAEVDGADGAGTESVDDAGELTPDEVYLADRAAALAPVQKAVARHLKRSLADEQNEVLDTLRREVAAATDIDGLAGAPADHSARYRNALTADLSTSAAAGARSVGSTDDAPSSEVRAAILDDVDSDLVAPLRERLARALEDAGGDTVEASATLRAAYREWRTQRADEIAAHLVLMAHGRGAYGAVEPGTAIRWVVDPEGPLCPDADDNALGGIIAAGEQFPTGHCHAPAHPGCRCGILPTQG